LIKVDRNEPRDAVDLFGQFVPAIIAPLNDEGYADYWWEGYDGQRHWERKQWGELTAGLDSVEYQLRKEMQAHPEAQLGLVVEGVATPSFMGTQLWSKAQGREGFYKNREQPTKFSMIEAWLYQVGKFVEIQFTADYLSTITALAAFYQSDQKPEHGTFQRHLKVADWHPNPQVEMLMSIGHKIGIGAAKADQIIRAKGTVWNVLNSSPEELERVEGVGPLLAKRLLRKVGRSDV